MKEIQKIKVEIETLKSQLRNYLERNADLEEVLELNYKIDKLIVKFYQMKKVDNTSPPCN
ncbi:hypothetical protein [Alkaliphilus peptidifermentans]|uniref:Spo0E like sporulation regulatory protein n=1 Tax=Alkaliphilus peptidifermentans DSM 18978 TaxID=1120976 RepID=A0A1G5JF73_9FIRM|nr:hypothetical protein [Alkaliphilus peptidifermentans]SCY87005.1 hypothetical protein SAMN03080606_02823 [Alkaliphilus peptidifermentans DSM 18978]